MSFGRLLRSWREDRRITQLDLAERAGISTRHLSFLEGGRCGPSREVVSKLAVALGLPERERSRLLLAAGHACDWAASRYDREEALPLLKRMDHLLYAHDPYPAFIMNDEWRIVCQNMGAKALFAHCHQMSGGDPEQSSSVRDLVANPRKLLGLVKNPAELLRHVLISLHSREPDPAECSYTADLYGAVENLLKEMEPINAMEFSKSGAMFKPRLHFADRGFEFHVDAAAIDFLGIFTFVICLPCEGSEEAASAYITELIVERFLADGPGVPSGPCRRR